ncbi:MAG: MBOAT family protein [Glaciecola sp.]
MLFNSIEFLFVFLPISMLVYYLSQRLVGAQLAVASLVVCSLIFYAWWNPSFVLLIIASIFINFYIGKRLSSPSNGNKTLLVLGIALNLCTLIYYKYTNFLVDNMSAITGLAVEIPDIILPLAISFFTFQQIAYLVDSYKGITQEYRFTHYCLFVTFFPQLIAGPIVHHKEMLPQFMQAKAASFQINNFMIGLSIFAIGLFKKTVLADNLAIYANETFNAADANQQIEFVQAWLGALCYTLQLYFDFSGYSDMAIGLARMFNIVLPLNFFSPYKSVSIVEFWRRWHITLSRFLRDYLYIPLGGNRAGTLKRYGNLFTTMIIGGIWHGAGWNFMIWGFMHGLYLCVCHLWQAITHTFPWLIMPRILSWFITMLAVIIAWVFFRATTLDGAFVMLNGMFGVNGIALPNGIMSRLGEIGTLLTHAGVTATNGGGSLMAKAIMFIFFGSVVVLALPNIYQIFSKVEAALSNETSFKQAFWGHTYLSWQANRRWAILCSLLLLTGLMTLGQISDFLYFQF